MSRKMVTIDGNEAAAYIAHKTNEVIAIYPITPSSAMGEHADAWSAADKKNIWGTTPSVIEMQSEGGAAGAVHGALQTGALTTTFTASQGLLLMIPNMYKIAAEMTPTVFHVSARTIATHALSIFGDHSDVMAVRQTGWSLLASGNVQEVQDFALISQAATLEARLPFLHFFDGFRTSHEVVKIEQLEDNDIKAMIDNNLVIANRKRGMNPNNPVLRGTAHNPDTYFQARETINPYYDAVPQIVQKTMDEFKKLTGRGYKLFDYYGAKDAEKVIIIMGSGAEAVHETVNALTNENEKVGVLKVRLYRPFSIEHFIKTLPSTVKKIAVLDRTKEPGAVGEPLYGDVVTALSEAANMDGYPFSETPKVYGGRYGLSSKEFTPSMIKAIFNNIDQETPKNHFTVGIHDDVSNTSLDVNEEYLLNEQGVFRGMFYGLGSDGTVGANKNSIKIIGEETENFAQGYFVYDSKKSGSTTVSHLRFGKKQIQSTYLIQHANFIAVHKFELLKTQDVLGNAVPGGIFLLNSPYSSDQVWNELPRNVQKHIIDKKLTFYNINARAVAKDAGMGTRINTIMQTCFFAISGILPQDEAIAKIKQAIEKTYGLKGESVVQKNYEAVDKTLENLHKVDVPEIETGVETKSMNISEDAPEFFKNVTSKIIAGEGDQLPVSAMPIDGTWPTATTQFEKRNISDEVPVWDPDICIQCNKCVMVCPHAVIRPKIYDKSLLSGAPETYKHVKAKGKEWNEDEVYTLQVSGEDCTGCTLCVDVCPVADKTNPDHKAINMENWLPIKEKEVENWNYFLNIPEVERSRLNHVTPRGSQLLQPLFEFSGACTGCGETPYVKLASQLFGDRMIIANATGCSSIYGGNLPTTPWAKNSDGRGPTWNNSLFEDNAEFGLGFRMTINKHQEHATELLEELRPKIGQDELVDAILNADQTTEPGIFEQRKRLEQLDVILQKMENPRAAQLLSLIDNLAKKSVWIMGGDGWAYDIGFGGLDHVIASGQDVNILVLDTEVYSNTGGQASKATPTGAIAKFAASGKSLGKKDLGAIAMSYGNVYVASVAMGASDTQTIRAFMEAEAYPGPSIIIAYSHCIAHGYGMEDGLKQQKAAVDSGYWTLYRYNPVNALEGKNPLKLDSKKPRLSLKEFLYHENRYKMLTKSMPERAEQLLHEAEKQVQANYESFVRRSSWTNESED